MGLLTGTRRALIGGRRSYYDKVLSYGPVAYWPLWETASPTDYLTFNGTTTWINCGSAASLDDLCAVGKQVTWDGWFRHPSDGSGTNTIMAKTPDFQNNGWYYNVGSAAQLRQTIRFDTTDGVVHSGGITLRDGQWHHYAFTFDNTSKVHKLYVDGVDVTTIEATASGTYQTDAAAVLEVGGMQSGSRYKGDMGWQRISNNIRWSSGFTPPSRTTTPTVDANTVSLWPMNEGYGSVAGDIGVNNNDGTITAGSWGAYPAARCLVNTAQNGAYTGVTLANASGPDGSPCPYFDGANDYVNVFSASLQSAFNASTGTLMIWTKVYNAGVWTDGAIRRAIQLRADSGNRVYIGRTAVNATLEYLYVAGSVYDGGVAAGHSETGWMHLALVWDAVNDTCVGYFNGSVDVSSITLGVWVGNIVNGVCNIGADATTPTSVWHGWIAHCAVWNRALTPAQIADLAVV